MYKGLEDLNTDTSRRRGSYGVQTLTSPGDLRTDKFRARRPYDEQKTGIENLMPGKDPELIRIRPPYSYGL
jgi:hypothetical protein